MTNTADLLEQIPDLGEDVKDPEDCFTEGKGTGEPEFLSTKALPCLTLSWSLLSFNILL